MEKEDRSRKLKGLAVTQVASVLAVAVMATFTAAAHAVVVSGFEGTSQANNHLLDGAFRPPDTMGAIGTTQYM